MATKHPEAPAIKVPAIPKDHLALALSGFTYGPGMTVRAGTKIRADDPRVTQNPIYFCDNEFDDFQVMAEIQARWPGLPIRSPR